MQPWRSTSRSVVERLLRADRSNCGCRLRGPPWCSAGSRRPTVSPGPGPRRPGAHLFRRAAGQGRSTATSRASSTRRPRAKRPPEVSTVATLGCCANRKPRDAERRGRVPGYDRMAGRAFGAGVDSAPTGSRVAAATTTCGSRSGSPSPAAVQALLAAWTALPVLTPGPLDVDVACRSHAAASVDPPDRSCGGQCGEDVGDFGACHVVGLGVGEADGAVRVDH